MNVISGREIQLFVVLQDANGYIADNWTTSLLEIKCFSPDSQEAESTFCIDEPVMNEVSSGVFSFSVLPGVCW